MCLEKLKNFQVNKMEGYKVVKKRFGKFHTEIKGERKPLPLRKWLNADDWKNTPQVYINTAFGNEYRLAWHIFITKKGAVMWCEEGDFVVKVEFRKIRAKGTQSHYGSYHVVVAQEMMILGEV